MDFFIEVPSDIQLQLRIMAGAETTGAAVHILREDLEYWRVRALVHLHMRLDGIAYVQTELKFANPIIYLLLAYWDHQTGFLKIPLEWIEHFCDYTDFTLQDRQPWRVILEVRTRPAYILHEGRKIALLSTTKEMLQPVISSQPVLPIDTALENIPKFANYETVIYEPLEHGAMIPYPTLQSLEQFHRLDEIVGIVKRLVESGKAQRLKVK